jgi:hypothetical protein
MAKKYTGRCACGAITGADYAKRRDIHEATPQMGEASRCAAVRQHASSLVIVRICF